MLPNICILIESFYPIVGGGETHAQLLCEALLERGVSLFVVTRRRTSAMKAYECVGKTAVYRVAPTGFQRFGKYLMIFPAFFLLLKKRHQYDVIYVCGLRVLGVLGVFLAMLLGKKCVLRAESCGEMSGDFIWQDHRQRAGKKRSPFLKGFIALRNRLLKKSDAFVSISQVIRDEFLSCDVSTDKIHAITNGIDVEKFSPVSKEIKTELRKRLKIPDKVIFTYTGKLNKGKGLSLLLQVWKRLVPKYKGIHLLLVGGGALQFLSCEHELRAYVERESLEDYVTFTGYTTHVVEYLQCADYFVFPSEREALGISLLEAQSCGLPCIATRTGGIFDVITDGENGKLISVNNELELREAIMELVCDSGKGREMAIRGRRNVIRRFSIQEISKKHAELFSSIVEN